MNYEWDPVKARLNHAKHGIRFSDAVSVFEDERSVMMLDQDADEERYLTIGYDALARLIVVIHTWRGELVRLISARKANRIEAHIYEEGEG